MKCEICGNETDNIFSQKVLNKYDIKYYHCGCCAFLQTEEPFWLEEAYRQPINITDTGIMARNISNSKITAAVSYFFNKHSRFLDYAGGYGILTRLMRDMGFDFYWCDKYTENIFAKGFEYDCLEDKDNIELITCFESFEHFVNPMVDVKKMLEISKNLLFTTNLLPDPVPGHGGWWYYGQEHGQHLSFYSVKTFMYIAKKYQLNLLTNGINIHLLTQKNINPMMFRVVLKLHKLGIESIVLKNMNSKTFSDMGLIKNKIENGRYENPI